MKAHATYDAVQIRSDFERIAALPTAGPDHNAVYHRHLLSHVPRTCERALDAGCGTGSFARLLADRAARVDATRSGAGDDRRGAAALRATSQHPLRGRRLHGAALGRGDLRRGRERGHAAPPPARAGFDASRGRAQARRHAARARLARSARAPRAPAKRPGVARRPHPRARDDGAADSEGRPASLG